MQVSFNPIVNNYKNPSFTALKKAEQKQEEKPVYNTPPTRDEIITARTKKAVSECKYVVFALGILYFAMKKNIKINRIRNHERKLAELAKMEVPVPELIKPETLSQLGL